MKKVILLFSVLFSQLIVAQSTEISTRYDKIGQYINGVAFVHKDGLVGFINRDGKEIVKPEYKKIGIFGSDNVAYTWKNDLVGLIDINGNVIVKNYYDHIGGFLFNMAFVKKNGLCGAIDLKGNVLIEPRYLKLKHGENGNLIATNLDGTVVILKPKK